MIDFSPYEQKYGLPKGIMNAVMMTESAGNPRAVSHAGAQGLFQIMPETAKDLGVDPFNPHQAADGAARYLKQNYDRFGNWDLALAGYNAGAGNVQKYGGVPPFEETKNYIQKVNSLMGEGQKAEVQGNYFDQFDTPQENFFSQYDGGNYFDQFDDSEKTQEQPKTEPDLARKGFVGRVLDDRQKRYQNMADTAQNYVSGDITKPEAYLQFAGNAAGFANDVAGEAIKSLAPVAQTAIKYNPALNTMNEAGNYVFNTIADSPVGDITRSAAAKYQEFAQEHPRAARNIEATGNIGALAAAFTPIKGKTPAGSAMAPVGKVGNAAVRKADRALGAAITKRQIPKTGIESPLQRVLSRSSSSPEQLLSDLRSGKISSIADVGGEEIRGITRALGRQEGAKNIISDNLRMRSEGAVSRVASDLGKVSRVDDYFSSLDEIIKSGRKKAAPLYDRAYSANRSIRSNEIDNILSTPAGRKALKDTARVMQNDRALMGLPDKELKAVQRDLSSIGKMDDVSGPIASGLNLRTLDAVKRNLDDQIGALLRNGANNEAGVLIGLKNNLKNEIIRADKTGAYKRALSESGDYLGMSSAMEAGRGFSNLRPEQIKKAVSKLSPAEKKAYRAGAREHLQKTIYKTSDGADPAKRIFGNKEKRDQIRAVLGDDKNYIRFEKRMIEESRAAETKQAVLGGSRTDINLYEDGAFIDAASDAVRRGVIRTTTDRAVGAIADAIRRKYSGITKKNAEEMARILTDRNKGIYEINRLVEIQKKSKEALPMSEILKLPPKEAKKYLNKR